MARILSKSYLNFDCRLAGVYCECSPEALRIFTKSFPPQNLGGFSPLGLCITPHFQAYTSDVCRSLCLTMMASLFMYYP